MDQRAVILILALLGGIYYVSQEAPKKEPDACPDGKCPVPVKPAPAPVKPAPKPKPNEPDEPIPEPLAPRRPRKP